MTYCTVAQLRQALAPGSLTDLANPPTPPSRTAADLSNEQLQSEIDEAASIVESGLSGLYVTPVANDPSTGSVPHPVDFWVRNIAAYLATCTFRKSQDFSDNDPVARRYNLTMARLSAVTKGTESLNIPTTVGSDSAAQGASAPVNAYSGNLFAAEDFNIYPRQNYPTGDGWPTPRPWEEPGWG